MPLPRPAPKMVCCTWSWVIRLPGNRGVVNVWPTWGISIVAMTRREQTPYHMLCFSLNLASDRVPKYTSCCLNSSRASLSRPYTTQSATRRKSYLPMSNKRLAGPACGDSSSHRAGWLTAPGNTAPADTYIQGSLPDSAYLLFYVHYHDLSLLGCCKIVDC